MSLIKKILAIGGVPAFLISCAQYKDELARQYYEHHKTKETPLQETPKSTEPKLEDKTKEFAQEDLDIVDSDSIGFVKIRNTQGIRLADNLDFNILGNAGTKGTWQDSIERGTTGTAQLKGILKTGEWRFAALFQDMYQLDRADPENHQTQDLTANLSRLIGSLGKHFATNDKDFMMYVEPVKIGIEYTDIRGPVDLWARDMLMGISIGCTSKSLNTLVRASGMASAGMLGMKGIDRYNGTIGKDQIPVEGEYGRAFGSVYVMQGLGANVYLFARAGADITKAEKCLETNTYTLSVGAQKRLKISQLPLAISASLYGRDHYKRFEGKDTARETEYGAMLRAQIDLLKGWYLESYLKFTPQYERGAFSGHFFKDAELESGLSLTGILGDMSGTEKKK